MTESKSQTSRKASSDATTKIAISAMMLALAVAFAAIAKYIPFLHFPQGGSIAIAMVPLALVGYYCGAVWGTLIGMAFGVLDMLLDGYYGYTWVTIFLDYIIAFGFAGLCGIFRKSFFQKKASALLFGMILFGVMRFLSSFLSGCIVWNTLNGEENYTGFLSMPIPDFSGGSIAYSLTYNGGYMIPSIVLCCILLVVLAKPIFTTLNFPRIRSLAPEISETESSSLMEQTYRLVPIYLVLVSILSILGTIPALGLASIGYVTMIASLTVTAYLIYLLIEKRENFSWKMTSIYLGIAVLVLAVSILAIVSAYSYGISYYSES